MSTATLLLHYDRPIDGDDLAYDVAQRLTVEHGRIVEKEAVAIMPKYAGTPGSGSAYCTRWDSGRCVFERRIFLRFDRAREEGAYIVVYYVLEEEC